MRERLLTLFIAFILAPVYFAVLRYRGWRDACSEGHQRGCDFYSFLGLLPVVAKSLRRFHGGNRHFPNVIRPRSFNERLYRRNFLEPFALPVMADKLLLNQLVRKTLGARFVAEIVAVAASPEQLAPLLKSVTPGSYFLKSNNGSGTNHKFSVPPGGLTAAQLGTLMTLGQRFLDSRFGYASGEWYYQTFQPMLFIEKSISDEDPYDYRMFVVDGEVRIIRVTKNHYSRAGIYGYTFSPDWELLDVTGAVPAGPLLGKPDNLAEMFELAVRVAAFANMDFVRVDLYCINQQLIVGEVTYTPSNTVQSNYNRSHFAAIWGTGPEAVNPAVSRAEAANGRDADAMRSEG